MVNIHASYYSSPTEISSISEYVAYDILYGYFEHIAKIVNQATFKFRDKANLKVFRQYFEHQNIIRNHISQKKKDNDKEKKEKPEENQIEQLSIKDESQALFQTYLSNYIYDINKEKRNKEGQISIEDESKALLKKYRDNHKYFELIHNYLISGMLDKSKGNKTDCIIGMSIFNMLEIYVKKETNIDLEDFYLDTSSTEKTVEIYDIGKIERCTSVLEKVKTLIPLAEEKDYQFKNKVNDAILVLEEVKRGFEEKQNIKYKIPEEEKKEDIPSSTTSYAGINVSSNVGAGF